MAIDLNGDRYYDHNLTRIEKGKLLDHISGKAVIEGFGTTPGTKPTTNSERKKEDSFPFLGHSIVSCIDDSPFYVISQINQ